MISIMLCYSATSGSSVADCGKPCRVDMGNVGLEDTLRDEIGREDFGTWLSEAQQQLGFLKKKHALKNPATIDYVISKAASHHKTSKSLEDITERIVALKSQF